MKQTLFLTATLFLVSGVCTAVEDHKAKDIAPQKRQASEAEKEMDELLATLGDEISPSGYRKLFIYSPEKLNKVEYKVGEAENWNKMVDATSSTHAAYGTDSFLPSAPGQKYTVRGIRPDGTRVTSLLEIDPKNGKVISVKVIKEESKEEVEKEKKVNQIAIGNPAPQGSDTGNSNFGTSAVLMNAQNNLGRRLGNGTCAALAGGARVGQISGGNFYQVQPGQVLRFTPGSSFSSSMGRFTVSSQGHYVVVENINPDGSFTFLHQNWAGGSSSGQTVRRDTGNLRTLNGSATIYTGN